MQRKPSVLAALFLVAVLMFQSFGAMLLAQATAAPPPPPTAAQLDQLLAPVALYPDSLLAQITTASTNPQEILDVDNWLALNKGLSGTALTDAAQQQGFDPAFIALTNFPSVMELRSRRIRRRCRRRFSGCVRRLIRRERCEARRSNRSRCSRTRGSRFM